MSKGGFAVEYQHLQDGTIRFKGFEHRLRFTNWYTTAQIIHVRDWCYDNVHGRYQWHDLSTVDFKDEANAFACMLRWRGVEIEVNR